MSKMREAFEEWANSEVPATYHPEQQAFYAGYQAAIAAVKEGGAKAYIYTRDQGKGNGWLTFNPPEFQDPEMMAEQEMVIDRLYKLPED